jgi:uncharacterized protein (TIGR03905 family)
MIEYKTSGTCATKIRFDMKDGAVQNVAFTNGCNGNLKALSILVEGMKADELITKLRGIDCGGRGTSCADQLSKAVSEAVSQPKPG